MGIGGTALTMKEITRAKPVDAYGGLAEAPGLHGYWGDGPHHESFHQGHASRRL